MPLLLEESIAIEAKKLVVILRDSLPEEDRPDFELFARLLEHVCHYKFQNLLGEVYTSYRSFHPKTNFLTQIDLLEDPQYAQNLIGRLKKFLEEAQYQKISEYDIRDILYFQRALVKIIFPVEKYQEFFVYFCGEDYTQKTYRSWRTLWLTKHATKIPYYKKLVVLFRPFKVFLKKADFKEWESEATSDIRNLTLPQPILLKLFQNVPYDYLPIIFPDALFKIPPERKWAWTGWLSLAGATGLTCSLLAHSPWYGLAGLLPILFFLNSVWKYSVDKEQYYQKLLSHFYSDNLSNNQGIFRHLIEQAEDETYKQLLVVLHALWQQNVWAFGAIHAGLLQSYLEKFLLEYGGVKVKLNLENILVELVRAGKDHNGFNNLQPLLAGKSETRTYLKQESLHETKLMHIESTALPVPRAGMMEIAPGTEIAEKNVFYRDSWILYIQEKEGLQCSHPAGAAIRWLVDKPYTTHLIQDCQPGSNALMVSAEDAQILPLQGIGKVVIGEENFEFRYYRHKNSNQLLLTAGLRYRHSHTANSPTLVRPLLPYFIVPMAMAEGSSDIQIPKDFCFPATGLIKVSHPGMDDFVTAYSLAVSPQETSLILEDKLPTTYPTGVRIALTPPLTRLRSLLPKGSWLIPVTSTKHFSKRGTIILAPGTEQEERLPFYREALLIELEMPLENYHREGSFVQIDRTTKTKIIRKAKRGTKSILVHSSGEEITDGTMIISAGQNHQEIRQFKVAAKYLYSGSPTRMPHPPETEIWEASLESALRYEAAQGSFLITVENAASFPLRGVLEIHFNGTDGVKEVFPFQHTKCSNTLLLTASTDRFLASGLKVMITAVEITTATPIHYHGSTARADFSCVSNFPDKGIIMIEPGSQSEEILKFERHPGRLYLKNRLKYDHPKGTVISFPSYAEYALPEPLVKNTDRLSLEFGYLLPNRGCLVLKTGEQNDMIWYRKIPHRVLLDKPCRFHHTRGSRLSFPGMEDNVAIAVAIEKGDQVIRVNNAQELPRKGRIKIQGIFRSLWTEFVREGDELFLQYPVPWNFPLHSHLSFPEVYLQSHLTPGMDYLEVSDPSLLPESGELILVKAPAGIYGPNRGTERIAFRHLPDFLWLDAPLSKRYESGTIVIAPELFVKGVGGFEVSTLADTIQGFKAWLGRQLDIVET